ncbi:fumarate reductase/succinate dehydrogenase flavoprotein subunit [Microvenator marinus]|jgi:succinate dehydrogenase / fumarate reductase flavoprotein subunit|uniref:succinate dehydrogenase n=1 Tax=Microvenator marinus TaxID=2600177 RepID=A0A5B8Y0V7_9DELT|nr:fumarate reductase/succinate dehydrogenase flavoprotein subunit [Microvenator marinus]QED29576.1 fumarate reductase/succinate dehydrogenase flavoprotein subunit [Microvenator marinus]
MTLDAGIPSGPLDEKWDRFKASMKLVSPANKRKHTIIVVGSGLAGASAAATLGELGYNVKCFCIQDSPRRAHSIAAQGGINAAKNYPYDGDSVYNLFYDTIKGGDYRSREGNVYRLAQVSTSIIDQCVAQGVPFAREYGGELAMRSFGGAQVSRTFYARGQTGQQLLLGAYGALNRQIEAGRVKMYSRREMLDLVVHDGQAKGIIARNLVTGELEKYAGHAVLLCTGGYGRVYFLSTNAFNSNGTAAWRAHKRGAMFGNPCYVQIHPTCIPQSGDYQSKLTLMSESLRNDGRVWVPREKEDAQALRDGKKKAADIPRDKRWYYLEEKYPSFGNLVPRDVASRNAKAMCDMGLGVNPTGRAVFLDFTDAIKEYGEDTIRDRYGNLFDMYQKITGDNPYQVPMKIYPAIHYAMGGLWVDYSLMTTIPGLFALGEANFSDHGANRLGASALMQGLADGYFVIPHTLGNYLATQKPTAIDTNHEAFVKTEKEVTEDIAKIIETGKTGTKSVVDIYKKLGEIMWDNVGMSRSEASLKKALEELPALVEEFERDVRVPADSDFNKYLELAMRTKDFLELAQLMARDALEREESCGGHFREEYQTPEGEALRNDDDFTYVSAWEWKGKADAHQLHKEPLVFENVKLTQRSYK